MDHEQQVVSEQLREKFKIRSLWNVSAELQPHITIFGSNRMKNQGMIQEELSQLCITFRLHKFCTCLHGKNFKDIVNYV